jgi:adenosylcobyric acid synthase
VLPWIANFDDFDPLRAEPDVTVDFIAPGRALPPCDLVVLAGSKATIADLAALRAEGWDIDLAAHRRRGGRVLGLCGGYQMLGRSIADPLGLEGPAGEATGLGMLDVATELGGQKTLAPVRGTWLGEQFHGFEMHLGRTTGADLARPMLRMADGQAAGAVSADGLVQGAYVHGLFAADAARAAFVATLGGAPARGSHGERVEETLDALAAHLEAHLNVDRLLTLAGAG